MNPSSITSSVAKRKTRSAHAVQGGTSEANRRAVAVLEVLGGLRTPADAAAALGLAVPRYYQLETRAGGNGDGARAAFPGKTAFPRGTRGSAAEGTGAGAARVGPAAGPGPCRPTEPRTQTVVRVKWTIAGQGPQRTPEAEADRSGAQGGCSAACIAQRSSRRRRRRITTGSDPAW